MDSSVPIWELMNRTGSRSSCYVSLVGSRYLGLVQRDNETIVSETHEHMRSALDRAEEVFDNLIADGWIGYPPGS
jgi:hypothetical protein